MAPSSANRNPETRKPARALPLPGARVAVVVLAMSIIFDCIISDVTLGKGLGGGGASRGANRVQPTNSKGGNWWQSPFCGARGVSTFGICRTGSRKREDSRALARSFSRLRMARGVHQPLRQVLV